MFDLDRVTPIPQDITLRWKILRGFKVHFIPGWDCHGLPIELKALQEAASDNDKNSNNATITYNDISGKAASVRDCAKKFADRAIAIQKDAFMSWNIVADWERGCYFTYDPAFEVAQLDLFYQMFRVSCFAESCIRI